MQISVVSSNILEDYKMLVLMYHCTWCHSSEENSLNTYQLHVVVVGFWEWKILK